MLIFFFLQGVVEPTAGFVPICELNLLCTEYLTEKHDFHLRLFLLQGLFM